MIDIEKAKLEFDNYAKKYDMEDETINRKYYHTYRVMKISGEIAKSLNLSEEEVELAKVIGLLHDIARFEQYKKFQTFSDLKSFDHGDYGAEILKKDNFIRKFVENNQYDSIIIKAVKNHNKFKIEKGLTQNELLYSKIVIDADNFGLSQLYQLRGRVGRTDRIAYAYLMYKLDIYYEILTMFYKDPKEVNELENEIIDNNTLEQIVKHETIVKKPNARSIDHFILIICLIFDLNFKYSFEIMHKEEYINKIIDKFDFKNQDTKDKMEKIKEELNNYIKLQLNIN